MTHPGEAAAPAKRKPREDEIDVYGLTQAVRARNENQDHFLICALHKSIAIHGSSLPGFTPLPSASPSSPWRLTGSGAARAERRRAESRSRWRGSWWIWAC